MKMMIPITLTEELLCLLLLMEVQDAVAKVRRFGRPSLFITITTNPEWKEIVDNLSDNQTPKDCPDLVGRVFSIKCKMMMKMIINGKIFGEIIVHELSIEYQKRGLQHAHSLIWLKNPIRLDDIDNFVSAEIPDKERDPELYNVVMKNMIHGLCSPYNRNSVRMVDGKCSKNFPKYFLQYIK